MSSQFCSYLCKCHVWALTHAPSGNFKSFRKVLVKLTYPSALNVIAIIRCRKNTKPFHAIKSPFPNFLNTFLQNPKTKTFENGLRPNPSVRAYTENVFTIFDKNEAWKCFQHQTAKKNDLVLRKFWSLSQYSVWGYSACTFYRTFHSSYGAQKFILLDDFTNQIEQIKSKFEFNMTQ